MRASGRYFIQNHSPKVADWMSVSIQKCRKMKIKNRCVTSAGVAGLLFWRFNSGKWPESVESKLFFVKICYFLYKNCYFSLKVVCGRWRRPKRCLEELPSKVKLFRLINLRVNEHRRSDNRFQVSHISIHPFTLALLTAMWNQIESESRPMNGMSLSCLAISHR